MTARWIAWLAALALAGCGPALYYEARLSHAYEYEKRVPIVVTSSPSGATITAADGTVLGVAPLVVEETVRVRREQRYCSTCLALVGCGVDMTAMIAGIGYAVDRPDSSLAQAAGWGGVLMGLGCIAFATGKFANWAALSMATHPQNRSFMSQPPTDRERPLERRVELVARWDGLGSAGVQLELPGATTAHLQLPRRYTFDEALVLWARQAAPPDTADNVFAVGSSYLNLARQKIAGAGRHAVRYFTLYLERYPTGGQAQAARDRLAEARQRADEGP